MVRVTCWVCDDKGASSGCDECGAVAEQVAGSDFASSFEEPVGFAQWLGKHCSIAQVAVPHAGTPRRRLLARVFAALGETGHDVPVLVRGLEVGEPERALVAAWGFLTGEFIERGEEQ